MMEISLAREWWEQAKDLPCDDITRLSAAYNLSNTLVDQGKRSEAEAIQREVLRMELQLYGEAHPVSMAAATELAQSLTLQGRLPAAEALHRQLFAMYRRTSGVDHPLTMSAANDLATILSRQEKHPEAEEIQRVVLEARRRMYGIEHHKTLAMRAQHQTPRFRRKFLGGDLVFHCKNTFREREESKN